MLAIFIFRMENSWEQRAAVKFCFLLGKDTADTVELLKTAYEDDALGEPQVLEWFTYFNNGKFSINDFPPPVRPSTSRNDEHVEQIRFLVYENRRRTIEELSELSGLPWKSVQRILSEDLSLWYIAEKCVPMLLTELQRENRFQVCSTLHDHFQSNPNFFSRIITGDEFWCHSYEPETKQPSSQWKHVIFTRKKKTLQAKCNVQTMLICFFDANGIVHSEFVPQHQILDQVFYLDVMERLRNSVRDKRPDFWQSGEWFFHHDNVSVHTAIPVRQYYAKNNIVLLPHPPYSPDLAPCDFFLFPRIKMNLKEKYFVDVNEVEQKTLEVLTNIKEDEFLRCFEQWKTKLEKCINSNGEYVFKEDEKVQ